MTLGQPDASSKATTVPEPVRGNVLVVEDELDCGMMVVNVLSADGYGTRLVKSRDAALISIRRYLYDYIILDVRMPGMNIPDFMKALSTSPARNARIIITTAENNVIDEAKKHNILNFLGKPFTPDQLLKLLANLKIFGRADSSNNLKTHDTNRQKGT